MFNFLGLPYVTVGRHFTLLSENYMLFASCTKPLISSLYQLPSLNNDAVVTDREQTCFYFPTHYCVSNTTKDLKFDEKI